MDYVGPYIDVIVTAAEDVGPVILRASSRLTKSPIELMNSDDAALNRLHWLESLHRTSAALAKTGQPEFMMHSFRESDAEQN